MENLRACRLCLATDVKLYDTIKYRLNTAYESLTGFQISLGSAHHICSYCGTLLNKFTTFKKQCHRSQQLLEHLLSEHDVITTDHIKCINRSSHNLSAPYTIQCVHSFDTTIFVKQEIYDNYNIKSDVDISGDEYNSFDTINDTSINNGVIINSYTKTDERESNSDNNDNDLLTKSSDSDEEPLSKKIKKKRREKYKKESNKATGELQCDRVIKSEKDCDADCQEQIRNKVKHVEDTQHKLVILNKEEQLQDVVLRKQTNNYKNSEYRCEDCCKGFMTVEAYNNHMMRHDPRCGPQVCDICRTHWPDTRSLRGHKLIAHERKYMCKVCGQVSRSKHKAAEHAAWHAGVTFPCASCGATFARSTTYLTHVRLRHPGAHRCTLCGESFIGDNGLKLHMKKAHRDEKSEASPDSHECDSCHFKFKNKEALARHAELATGGGCDLDVFPCSECGDNFPTEERRNEHLRMHRRALAVRTCSQCSRTFANARTLAAHCMRMHSRTHSQRPHAHTDTNCVCEICGYKCVSKASLVNHQRTHTGEKPYECTYCHKRFSVYQRLQIHYRTHTGERPYPCAECPKAFKHKAALNRHIRVHTGVKPYSCPQCGKSFSQSNSMKQHCAGVHMKAYLYARKPANKTS